mgnify:CR=1 FL=1
MIQRVKQVAAALTAQVSDRDWKFVRKHLNEDGERLFTAMNLPDKRHVLNVAYTAMKLAACVDDVNKLLLIRCALLHDAGKQQGDVSTWDKIAAVLAYNIAPRWARQWARYGRGTKIANLRHAFHIYFHHAARSAEMLRALGLEAEAAIVARHHDAPQPGEPIELTLLRQADDLH